MSTGKSSDHTCESSVLSLKTRKPVLKLRRREKLKQKMEQAQPRYEMPLMDNSPVGESMVVDDFFAYQL